jgi:hypothetical protein
MVRLGSTIVLAALLAGAAFAANPHDPQKRFTAADQAWARKLVVTRADLTGTGWTAQKSTDDSTTCRSFNPDESDLVETGERQSLEFTRGGSFVMSTAAIFANASQARAMWNREMRPQLLDCLAEGLKGTSTGDATVKITARGPLSFPKLAERTAAFRVHLAFNVQGIKFGAELHIICLGRGRANLALMTMSPGKPLSPLPAGLERTLAARLAQRLRG